MREIDNERRQLEADVNALLKLVLIEMETLAGQHPDEACEPVRFNEMRTAVMRRQWSVIKRAIQYGQNVRFSEEQA